MEHRPAISVVVVGGPDELVDATKHAALTATTARVHSCDLSQAATTVARIRPYAIVVDESVYGFDSSEFDALARDVNAEIVRVDSSGKSAADLRQRLLAPLTDAFRTHFSD